MFTSTSLFSSEDSPLDCPSVSIVSFSFRFAASFSFFSFSAWASTLVHSSSVKLLIWAPMAISSSSILSEYSSFVSGSPFAVCSSPSIRISFWFFICASSSSTFFSISIPIRLLFPPLLAKNGFVSSISSFTFLCHSSWLIDSSLSKSNSISFFFFCSSFLLASSNLLALSALALSTIESPPLVIFSPLFPMIWSFAILFAALIVSLPLSINDLIFPCLASFLTLVLVGLC